MDPVTWAEDKGPAYVGLVVGSTICVVILIGYTGMRINNPSYQPVIEPTLIAAVGAILWTAGKKLDKSDNGSNST
jgi:hypothetical protein